MILHRNNENTYLEKIGTIYVMYINGWFYGALSARDIQKAAKEHGHGVDTEAIELFKKILEVENAEKMKKWAITLKNTVGTNLLQKKNFKKSIDK